MLRGTPEHPKTDALMIALDIGRAQAVGHLELLWHFAQRYAPAGDVGRWPDGAIESACAWCGEPGNLVRALVKCCWLDESPEYRLIVHDWHEHSDRYVRRKVARQGLAIATLKRAPGGRPKGAHGAAGGPSTGSPAGAGAGDQSQRQRPAPVVPPSPAGDDSHRPILVAWSRDACDAWIARFGGTAPGGQIGKALKPLVDRHGWSEVATAWRSYLIQTDAEYASPSRFAATYGRWTGTAPPGTARESSAEVLRAAVMGGLKGK